LTSAELGFFTYGALKSGQYPETLDKTKKELYLSDEDFQRLFSMNKDAFSKLPAWRVKKIKQNLNLF